MQNKSKQIILSVWSIEGHNLWHTVSSYGPPCSRIYLIKWIFTFQVHEKVVLPTAEDLKQEKVHESLLQGVETFSPDHLKPTKTREPASATEGKAEMRHAFSVCLYCMQLRFQSHYVDLSQPL